MNPNAMVTVSKDEFYAAMTGNVHLYHGRQKWSNVTGYTAEWRTPHGEVLALSSGIDHLHNKLYMLTPSLYSSLSPKQKPQGGTKLNPEFIDGGFYDPANDEPGEPLTQTDYEPLTD